MAGLAAGALDYGEQAVDRGGLWKRSVLMIFSSKVDVSCLQSVIADKAFPDAF